MKNYRFIRYGGVNSISQKGYNPNDVGMHNPPARHGIYAMPYDSVDLYLISPIDFHNRKTNRQILSPHVEFVKDSKGNKIILNWNQYCGEEEYPPEAKKLLNSQYNPNDPNSRMFRKNIYIETFWKGDTSAEDYEYNEDTFSYSAFIKYKKPKSFTYNGNIWNHLNAYVTIPDKDILNTNGYWILMNFKSWCKYYKYAKNYNNHKNFPNKSSCDFLSREYFEVFIEKI